MLAHGLWTLYGLFSHQLLRGIWKRITIISLGSAPLAQLKCLNSRSLAENMACGYEYLKGIGGSPIRACRMAPDAIREVIQGREILCGIGDDPGITFPS